MPGSGHGSPLERTRRQTTAARRVVLVAALATACASSGEAPEGLDARDGTTSSPRLTPTEGALARAGDRTLELADLAPRQRLELAELELQRYALLVDAAEAFVDDASVEAAAKEAGVDPTRFLEGRIEQRIAPVSEAAVEAELEAPRYVGVLEREYAKIQLPAELESAVEAGDVEARARVEELRADVRERHGSVIRARLARQARQVARTEVLADLRKRLDAKVTVPPPSAPRITPPREGFAVRVGEGERAGALHVVVDPSARQAAVLVTKLDSALAGGGGRALHVTYLPSSASPEAHQYAQALQCAIRQDLGVEYHEAIFAEDAPVPVEGLVATATAAGLDGNAFATCYSRGEARSDVQALQDAARRAGLEAPSILVDGLLIPPEHFDLLPRLLGSS